MSTFCDIGERWCICIYDKVEKFMVFCSVRYLHWWRCIPTAAIKISSQCTHYSRIAKRYCEIAGTWPFFQQVKRHQSLRLSSLLLTVIIAGSTLQSMSLSLKAVDVVRDISSFVILGVLRQCAFVAYHAYFAARNWLGAALLALGPTAARGEMSRLMEAETTSTAGAMLCVMRMSATLGGTAKREKQRQRRSKFIIWHRGNLIIITYSLSMLSVISLLISRLLRHRAQFPRSCAMIVLVAFGDDSSGGEIIIS